MTLKLNEIRMRDPFILEAGNLYYLYGTTDENLWGGPATGFDYYTSKDLEDWDGPFQAFRPSVGFWSDTQYWAPEVHEYSGSFFMFATFATSDPKHKVRGTAVLKAASPAGPFQPWSDGPVTPVNLPCLDGTFFVDEDKHPWIVYSRGAEGSLTAKGIDDGEMFAAKLTRDLKQLADEPQLLFTSKSASWSRPLWFPPGVEPPAELGLAKDPHFTDGPFLFRTPNGTLKMIWSAFGNAGYAIGVATSVSGEVIGPWKQEQSPLWAENGGHGMILHRSNGTDFLTFHSPNETPNERVQLVQLDITDDGVNIVK